MSDTEQPAPSAALSSEDTQPRLLKLPAELRNRIYRLSMLDDEDVIVDINFKLPALLQVCRKIRQEAKSIYFLEQPHQVDVTGFESKYYAAFLHTLGGDEFYEKMIRRKMLSVTTVGDSVKWESVVAWCKEFYLGKLPRCYVITGTAGRNEAEKVASRTFKITDKLKEKLEWDELEDILWQYKFGTDDASNGWWAWSGEEEEASDD